MANFFDIHLPWPSLILIQHFGRNWEHQVEPKEWLDFYVWTSSLNSLTFPSIFQPFPWLFPDFQDSGYPGKDNDWKILTHWFLMTSTDVMGFQSPTPNHVSGRPISICFPQGYRARKVFSVAGLNGLNKYQVFQDKPFTPKAVVTHSLEVPKYKSRPQARHSSFCALILHRVLHDRKYSDPGQKNTACILR